MTSWLERYNKNKKTLMDANLYHPSQEHDACGVGFIASIDGIPNRRVVISGIEALKAVWHRGAVDGQPHTWQSLIGCRDLFGVYRPDPVFWKQCRRP